jgi:dTDP-4-amino-4,6-dideoxygalactose transaminase
MDIGSSYLPGEVTAAFLWAQMEEAQSITHRRLAIWEYYHETLASLALAGRLRRPVIPDDCQHNAHMYHIVLESLEQRTALISKLKEQEVYAVFHYVPLHTSPAGKKYGRVSGELRNTEKLSECLLRLPMWIGMSEQQQAKIVNVIGRELNRPLSA